MIDRVPCDIGPMLPVRLARCISQDFHACRHGFAQGTAIDGIDDIGGTHFADIVPLHAKTQHSPLALPQLGHEFPQVAAGPLTHSIREQGQPSWHRGRDIFHFQITIRRFEAWPVSRKSTRNPSAAMTSPLSPV